MPKKDDQPVHIASFDDLVFLAKLLDRRIDDLIGIKVRVTVKVPKTKPASTGVRGKEI